MADPDTYRSVMREAWAEDTSADPDKWTPANPAWGQCAVTALVLQDFLGGELRRALVNGVSHYWLRLPDGTDVDYTREQFGGGPLTIEDEQPRTRDYALSGETAARYDRLRERVLSSMKRRVMRKVLDR